MTRILVRPPWYTPKEKYLTWGIAKETQSDNNSCLLSEPEERPKDDQLFPDGGRLPDFTPLANITTYTGRNVVIDFRITGDPAPTVAW